MAFLDDFDFDPEVIMKRLNDLTFYNYSQWCFNNLHWVLIICLVLMQLSNVLRLYCVKFPETPGSKVVDLKTDAEFDQLVKETPSGCILCVDFYATWCPPCRKAAPVMAEWSKTYDPKIVKFGKVDVDKNKATADRFEVKSLPSFLFFDSEGNSLGTIVGFRPKEVQKEIESQTKKTK